MRQREIVKIDDKEFTIKELTVKEVLDRMSSLENHLDVFDLLMEAAYPCLRLSLGEITKEALQELTPSEIENLWEACKRVNGPLFKTLEKFKVQETVEAIAVKFMTSLPETFANSLKPGTPGFSNTAGPGSSIHGTPINGF